jgi:molecular chaperone GrpE
VQQARAEPSSLAEPAEAELPDEKLDDDCNDESAVPVADSELEEMLSAFRDWYEDHVANAGGPAAPVPASVDLHTLLGHYLALRQEIHLQTRAVRAVQEQNSELIRDLQKSLELLSRTQSRNDQLAREAQDERLRPLLDTLIELYDALSLASRELLKAQQGLEALSEEVNAALADEWPVPKPPPAPPPRSFWTRWWLSPGGEALLQQSQQREHAALLALQRLHEQRATTARRVAETTLRVREGVTALINGYQMSLERIDRALRKHGLEPIPTVGQFFDPERMEAVARQAGSGRPNQEVLTELRRGYLYNGRVYRYAQVQVAVSHLP